MALDPNPYQSDYRESETQKTEPYTFQHFAVTKWRHLTKRERAMYLLGVGTCLGGVGLAVIVQFLLPSILRMLGF